MAFLGLPIVTAIVEKVVGIIDKIIPDTVARDKAKADMTMELLRQDWSNVQAQLEINKEEAKHQSLFVAGWRPAIGWVCGGAFAYHYILQPFLIFGFKTAGVAVPDLPVLEMADLLTILGGMLGLGGFRTIEKIKGVSGTGQ